MEESMPWDLQSYFSQYEASTHCFLQTLFYSPYESVTFVKNHALIAGNVYCLVVCLIGAQ